MGYYGLIGDTTVIFYRDNGLYLRIGGTVVPVDDTVAVSHERDDGHHVLQAADVVSGLLIVRLEYRRPDPDIAPEDDFTPFVEPEDFNFGLFISNVANDRSRRSQIYRLDLQHGPD